MRHALSEEEQYAFIGYVENSPVYYRWAPFFRIMLGTGMRVGEALALRWDDVDFDNRKISISHSLSNYLDYSEKGEGSIVCTISAPKTEAGIRVIPIIDTVYEALKDQREYARESGGCITEMNGMDDFVFFNRYNEIQKSHNVNSAIKSIIERYNSEEVLNARREHRDPVILPHFTCHHLRHTFCTRLCEADVNLKVIQQIMGHKNISTTLDIYAEVSETKKQDDLKEFAEKFKNIF